MINYEIKSQLAKLLATEDLVVENRNVETASFNVETRVLTLPKWQRASEGLYDMLVGHEVGHALYTPNEEWEKQTKAPQSFLNITEDARIEKLMKRRYPGLSKSFFKGYQELANNDFFEVVDKDISKMSFADRANLYFKIGKFVTIPFHNETEYSIIDMMHDSETFADAILAAEEMYKYCKEQSYQDENPDQTSSTTGTGNVEGDNKSGETSDGDSSEEGDDGESEGENNNQSVEGSTDSSESGQAPETETFTDDMFSEGMKELNSESGNDSNYFEIPKILMDKVVVSNEEIHKIIDQHWKIFDSFDDNPFEYHDNKFNEFRRTSQKEVNYLVKEFECKKAADAYSRTSVSKTGVLDCSKLHTYKYNEDLFKRVSIVPDGKNHGLIFYFDWSGSMCEYLLETVKQLLNLVMFCKKVSIPFEVYTFTTAYQSRDEREDKVEERIVGEFHINRDFNLVQILTDKVSSKEFINQMRNIWRISSYYSRTYYRCDYTPPIEMSLGGTPLNEALVMFHQIIPQFKKSNGLQKVQCVILTDGEANVLPVNYNYSYNNEEVITSSYYSYGYHSYLRNRKTGRTYNIPHEYHKFTEVILRDLRDTFTNTNFIGIRVCGGAGSLSAFVRKYQDLNPTDTKKMKKNKYFDIEKSGYNSYFGIVSTILSNDTEFDVEEGATKAKIKSAFIKNLKSKSLNKEVLNRFIDLVC